MTVSGTNRVDRAVGSNASAGIHHGRVGQEDKQPGAVGGDDDDGSSGVAGRRRPYALKSSSSREHGEKRGKRRFVITYQASEKDMLAVLERCGDAVHKKGRG